MTAKRAVALVVLLVISACGGSAETNAPVTTTSVAPTMTQAPATTTPTATVAPTTTQAPATTTTTTTQAPATTTTTTTQAPATVMAATPSATFSQEVNGHLVETAVICGVDGLEVEYRLDGQPIDPETAGLRFTQGAQSFHRVVGAEDGDGPDYLFDGGWWVEDRTDGVSCEPYEGPNWEDFTDESVLVTEIIWADTELRDILCPQLLPDPIGVGDCVVDFDYVRRATVDGHRLEIGFDCAAAGVGEAWWVVDGVMVANRYYHPPEVSYEDYEEWVVAPMRDLYGDTVYDYVAYAHWLDGEAFVFDIGRVKIDLNLEAFIERDNCLLLDWFADPQTTTTQAPTTTAPTETTMATGSEYLGSYTLVDEEFGTMVTVAVGGSIRTIDSNALPDHETGAFPNEGNPNTIAEQEASYEFATEPIYTGAATGVGITGVAVNGVKFEPGTAETVTCATGETFRVEALQDIYNLGLDFNNAHVQPTGEYHYHGVSQLLVEAYEHGDDLVHVGFAADGFLMYYSKSGTYESGYELATAARTGTDCVLSLPPGDTVNIGGTSPDGTYTSDWVYNEGDGGLDSCNGITIGDEYLYVITDDYPYVGRCLNGEVSADTGGPGGGPGTGGPGGGPGGPPDLTVAAEALGVTVAELQAALGPPPPDIAGAAATLGVDVEVLRELIERP